MFDETIKQYIEQERRAREVLGLESIGRGGTSQAIARYFHDNQKLSDYMEEQTRARKALGIDGLSADSIKQAVQGVELGQDYLAESRKKLSDYDGQFSRLGIIDLEGLLSGGFNPKPLTKVLSGLDALNYASPFDFAWVNRSSTLESFRSYLELQSLGLAITKYPCFGNRLSDAVRLDLGDWRDRITWPDVIFAEPQARSDFYIDRGFDASITDFPRPAFVDGLQGRTPKAKAATVSDLYGPLSFTQTDDPEQDGLTRAHDAQGWIASFENRFRHFIDGLMVQAFGPQWEKSRLPNGLYDLWMQKKQNALSRGERERPLIWYADFQDYELVICKRDNWEATFRAHFKRRESIRESLQRLYPSRVCVMHSRPLTQDDELLLYVELKRIGMILKVDVAGAIRGGA